MSSVLSFISTLMSPRSRLPSLNKISSILLIIILLPALVYSVYEINSLSTTEELMNQIYEKQLDVILFSLNQYAWDVANSWAGTLSAADGEGGNPDDPGFRERVEEFLQNRRSISIVFITDSLMRSIHVFPHGRPPGVSEQEVRLSLDSAGAKIRRLARLKSADYRRLEPLIMSSKETTRKKIALVFLGNGRATMRHTIGMVIDPAVFIDDILSQRIRDVAGDEFILAVIHQGERDPVYASAPVSAADLRKSKSLWLLPDYSLAIRMQGETVGEIVRARFYRNLALLVILDLVLLAGAWVIYRTLRHEMELVRLKSDFVSNVSHELRTPLSLIRMYAETLQLGRTQSEQQRNEYYGTMLRETERLTRLVNNMLHFSRMEAGKKHYDMHPTDLNDLVHRVVEEYTPHLQSQGFAVSVTAADPLPEIRADGESVAESIINILENAAKYSPTEKEIHVATGKTDETVFVDIEDHGIGIAADQREKIFEKFYRVATGLVHTTKGSGLGLALVRYIMDAHGGTVTVHSTPGKGSTFRMAFPVHGAHGPESPVNTRNAL